MLRGVMPRMRAGPFTVGRPMVLVQPSGVRDPKGPTASSSSASRGFGFGKGNLCLCWGSRHRRSSPVLSAPLGGLDPEESRILRNRRGAPSGDQAKDTGKPVDRSVCVRLRTLNFHGYARLRTLKPQPSARLCTLGFTDTEVDLLCNHALVLRRNKSGARGLVV